MEYRRGKKASLKRAHNKMRRRIKVVNMLRRLDKGGKQGERKNGLEDASGQDEIST